VLGLVWRITHLASSASQGASKLSSSCSFTSLGPTKHILGEIDSCSLLCASNIMIYDDKTCLCTCCKILMACWISKRRPTPSWILSKTWNCFREVSLMPSFRNEMKDKPRISYSKIRGYSKVYPQVKFWRFSNIFILWVQLRISQVSKTGH